MRTKIRKKLLTFLLASGAGIAVFFSHTPLDTYSPSLVPQVSATAVGESADGSSASEGTTEDGGSTTTTKKETDSKKDFADTLEIVLKIIYLLLWPFLALAGLSLDNGMVYGSYFQLDAALFTFRNIVKNFANFTLGFLFLVSILQYIFNFSKSAKSPLDMITKLLMAGIGIQASWFIIGGLIDVSTVATVGIGGLPLQLLKDENAGKKPVFGVKASMNISDIGNVLTTDKGFVILYTYPKKGGEEGSSEYYLPCAIKNQKLLKDDEWASAFGVPKGEGGSIDSSAKIGNSDVSRSEINKEYCMFGNNILSFGKAGDKIEPGSDDLKQALKDSQEDFLSGKGCSADASLCQTISNIAQKGKGYQGAFYALYGSLLNLGSINVNVYKSNGSMAMEAIIKALIGIAYLFPLLVLCVVLIIRVAVLWIMIAFSPLLVLAEVFGFDKFGKKAEGLKGKFGMTSVIGLIFLPVIVTFAISISIVFLSVLSEGMTKGDALKDTGMETSSEGNKTCMNLIITKLCIDNPSQDIGISGMVDFFPWIILNICGIGLMRTILMTAMKGSQFTEKVVGGMDTFARNMIASAPIIPFPGGRTSIKALKNTGDKITSDINNAAADNARDVVSPTLQNMINTVTGHTAKVKEKINTAASGIKDKDSATRTVQSLIGTGGALSSSPGNNSFINGTGNNTDLEHYGDAGLNLVNKLAGIAGLSATYKSVNDAFSDPKFLEGLNKDLKLDNQAIRRLYTNRAIGKDEIQQQILDNIDNLGKESSSAILSSDHTTYTDEEGSTYTLTGNGFSKKSKDGKKTTTLTKASNWDDIKMSKEDIEKMKKKFEKDSPSTKFTKEFEGWLNKKTGSTSAPAQPTQQPPANNATPATPPNNTNTNNTNTTPPPATPNNSQANPTGSTTGAPNPGATPNPPTATPATNTNTTANNTTTATPPPPAPANNTTNNTATPPTNNPAPAPNNGTVTPPAQPAAPAPNGGPGTNTTGAGNTPPTPTP